MILAIDATNWIHSLWHAQGGRGVLNSVTTRIEALTDRFQPAHVVACFDRRSFRHDLWPTYKAGRKEKPEGLLRDLAEGPSHLAQWASICAEDGYEADDCLASLATAGRKIGQKIVIASPDKDLHQCLIENQVTILKKIGLRGRDVECCQWYTATQLLNETGLIAAQWPDFQALCGDSTDNVPGCPGWGEVTSLKALAQAGSIANMLRNPWVLSVTPKQRTKLLNFKSQAEIMLQLVTLKTDVAAAWDCLR